MKKSNVQSRLERFLSVVVKCSIKCLAAHAGPAVHDAQNTTPVIQNLSRSIFHNQTSSGSLDEDKVPKKPTGLSRQMCGLSVMSTKKT